MSKIRHFSFTETTDALFSNNVSQQFWPPKGLLVMSADILDCDKITYWICDFSYMLRI